MLRDKKFVVVRGFHMERVLIIEDDQILVDGLSETLRNGGFLPVAALDGLSGLQEFYEQRPVLTILDITLPGMDGWTVASRIREVSDAPLIMLTVESAEEEMLRAFALGADDCVSKPFSGAVLVARVDAVLKRAKANGYQQGASFTSGDLTIDFAGRRVIKNEEVVNLTPTEFRLLAVLARHAGRTLPQDYLLANVWGPGYEGEVGYIKHYVWALRQKLEEDPASPCHLLTEHGFGYRFE
jgi:two-component system KDP operon response regulator KdpE